MTENGTKFVTKFGASKRLSNAIILPLQDKAHGFGTLVFAKGDKYIGRWKNGQKHGQGELNYANGDCFRGEWVHDHANGFGELIYRHGGKYEGSWVNDKVMIRFQCWL
jgi:hypothetical protein